MKIKKIKKRSYYMRIFQKNRLLLTITLFISIISSASGAGLALLLKRIIDVTVTGNMGKFKNNLILDLIYLGLLAVITYISSIFGKILLKKIVKNMRESIFTGIFRRSYQDFYDGNTADYISVLTNDIKLVEDNYIVPFLEIIRNIITFVFTLILLLFISPIITLILFLGLILMILIPGAIGQRLQKKQEEFSEQYSVFTARIKDLFSGFEVIKSFHLFSKIEQQFQVENDILTNKKFKTDRLFVLNETVAQFLAVFSQIFTIFAGAYLVIKGNITMGTLIAIIQLSGSFVTPLIFIMQSFPKIQSVAPIMGRIQKFDDYIDTAFQGSNKPEFKECIHISDLSFSYQEQNPVLDHINLNMVKGEKYAIVGESGCGKSTLVKLLMGYYPDFTGDIFYDQLKLRDCNIETISELASVIHQNVYMFDKSIRDNICLYHDYSKEDIEDAINKSGMDRFLKTMPEQLETMVGENGANLSGGQRQRIAIARALIKGTPILILDEGTSALDQQTSNDIIQNLLGNKELTLITITHNLNEELLKAYDQIIYMEEGQVMEQGSYVELINNNKRFYHFCFN